MRPHFPAMNEWVASSETASTSSLCGTNETGYIAALSHSIKAIWTTYLNLLDTVTHRDSSDTHQRVRLYAESPLLALLLLGMADAAPTHNTVLKRASCKHTLKVTSCICMFKYEPLGTSISTFMAKTFEKSNIIQPQHLADVHIIWQNNQLICHISE